MSTPDDTSAIEPVADLPRVLLAALEQTRSPACITTAELELPGPRIVYVNPAYCAMTGRRREDVLGRTPRIMQGPLTDRDVLDRLRSDLAAGRRFSGETVNYRADGAPFIINWSIDPVRDETGTITHFVATQQDVTVEVRSANLAVAEQELDRRLRRVLNDPSTAADDLTAMADAVAAGAHRIADTGTARVLVVDEGHDHEISVEHTSDRGRRAQGDRTVAVPFSDPSGTVSGTITIGRLDDASLAFVDRPGLEAFAERAGAVLAAFVEYHRQRRTALLLQESLLPPPTLQLAGHDVHTAYRPGTRGLEVGGDWYDAVGVGDRAVVSVGDVSGSGVDAAALMGRLRTLATHLFGEGRSVGEVLATLDGVCRSERGLATMAVVELDQRGRARVWLAGHLPPVIVGSDATTVLAARAAPPLGFLEGAAPAPTELELADEDMVLLFTDGLVERRDEPITESLDRVVSIAAGAVDPQALIDDLVTRLGHEPADDIAVLAVRRRLDPAPPHDGP